MMLSLTLALCSIVIGQSSRKSVIGQISTRLVFARSPDRAGQDKRCQFQEIESAL
jgi:hypothetical protein